MGWFKTARNVVIGRSREISDEGLFHKVSLVALLAWVGLGSDGLSSSCYGPEESFKVLVKHPHLAVLVALMATLTVIIICASYSQIIELFPSGGGGYVVASKLLSPATGVFSGCALLVDYVLTVAISIASGADALFSILPPSWVGFKLAVAAGGVIVLTVLNMRGVKESVTFWVPVFLIFLFTHAVAIAVAFFEHAGSLGQFAGHVGDDLHASYNELGGVALIILLLRAYSMGAGTYTGIEAVSNGLPILREPRVKTGKRTMVLMAVSLAATVAGLLIAYLLAGAVPAEGKTLNAVLLEKLTEAWSPAFGKSFVWITLFSEAALLFIAAQTGFLDGPRVLANMAADRWFPSRFTLLSDRFVGLNGILMVGGAAFAVLVLARGSVDLLVVLYSINVFITFSLSQLGMVVHWWQDRKTAPGWMRKLAVNGVGFAMTAFILVTLCAVKFHEGGWITLVLTGLLVVLAFAIRRHYDDTRRQLGRLEAIVEAAEISAEAADARRAALQKTGRTAVFLVNGYNGLGYHTVFNALRMFPQTFDQIIFVMVGLVDAQTFKGADEIERLRAHTAEDAERYVRQMERRGFGSSAYTAVGRDVVEEVIKLVPDLRKRFPHAVFFGGQLVFEHEGFINRLLHNYTVFLLQRRLYQHGVPFVVLPVRVGPVPPTTAAAPA